VQSAASARAGDCLSRKSGTPANGRRLWASEISGEGDRCLLGAAHGRSQQRMPGGVRVMMRVDHALSTEIADARYPKWRRPYLWKCLAPRAGFEPATIRLTVECSTAELPRNRADRVRNGERITKPPSLAKDEMIRFAMASIRGGKCLCHSGLPAFCDGVGWAAQRFATRFRDRSVPRTDRQIDKFTDDPPPRRISQR
jgi:hypothetical protein